MKNILIVSYYFAPANMMGAIRGTKIAKYLGRQGYNVNVVSSEESRYVFASAPLAEDPTLVSDASAIKVCRLRHSSWYLQFAASVARRIGKIGDRAPSAATQKSTIRNRFFQSLFLSIRKFVYFVLCLVQDFDFLFNFATNSECRDLAARSDTVITTYGPYGSHFAGIYLKTRRGNKIRWIADFRDPIAQPTDGWIQWAFNRAVERITCNISDHVVAVSEGYLDSITRGCHMNLHKTSVIHNGYDTDDIANIAVKTALPGQGLAFCYTGTTYAGRRDLSPLLRAIKDLADSRIVPLEHVAFTYAGPEKRLVEELFANYGLRHVLTAHDPVSRLESLKMNQQSNLIVVATWDDSGHRGVLPGKFFESMVFEKPIICLVNGVERGSEIAKIVRQYEIGFCYEESNRNSDYLQLKDFLADMYLRRGAGLDEATGASRTREFHYSSTANKFSKLIEAIADSSK
jgi:glycosyltransferase involved in cell wall biosynthesis